MRVSVLTPTFNRRGSFLPRCLESVRGQLGEGFSYEHIVIDDCSTDGTWDYLQNVAAFDPHVKPARTEANLNPAHALNCALRVAKSELVLPLDDDDMLLPRSLKMHCEFMTRQPDVDWSFGDAVLVDHDDRVQLSAERTEVFSGESAYSDDPRELFEILLRANIVVNSTVIIRREAVLDVGGWDENVSCQDWALWLSLAHASKRHKRHPSYLSCCRIHVHQLSAQHSKDGTWERDRRYFLQRYGRWMR